MQSSLLLIQRKNRLESELIYARQAAKTAAKERAHAFGINGLSRASTKRNAGLPGGASLRLEALLGSHYNWYLAGFVPVVVAMVGLIERFVGVLPWVRRGQYRPGERACRCHAAWVTYHLRQLNLYCHDRLYPGSVLGRNAYQWFSQAFTDTASARLILCNELQEAIEFQAFELYYQPLINRVGQLAGVEALLRWPHPTKVVVA